MESLKQEGLELAINNRPNTPGTYNPRINWNWRAQGPVEKMLSDDEYIQYLRAIHTQAERI